MKTKYQNIDFSIIAFPFLFIATLFVFFVLFPGQSTQVLNTVRGYMGNQFGSYYLLLGLGIFILTVILACSKYGKIRLGNAEKQSYTDFQWGSMIFTSTLAADILFYSMSEWAMYANEQHIHNLGSIQDWTLTFSLFHWGPIAWGIYIILAVAFGFMLHIRGRKKQRFSEACRPLLGDKVDGIHGKVIDIICVVALLCGTATTFSVTTPLLSAGISRVFGLANTIRLVIIVLVLIAVVYTITVLFGMKGISRLASFCVYVFFSLLLYVFVTGGQAVYILETGISSLGNMIQNFIYLSTYTDPMRTNSFPQNWTLYYWAYWMAWCVATPFFIAEISKGRTIRNVILGCYIYGLSGTFLSFIILGGFGLGQQMSSNTGLANVIYNADFSICYEEILNIFNPLPSPEIGIVLIIVSMVLFYSTTFDTLTIVVSNYSYKHFISEEMSGKVMRTFWSIVFILFPIALIFSENTLSSLQSVSIIAAFPIGIIIMLVIRSFFKDANIYLKEIGYQDPIIECPEDFGHDQ